jgi:hypothetical protein
MYFAIQPDLDFERRTHHPQPRIGNEQNAKILNHMLSGNSITAFEALQLFGCLRLAARIHDIRKMGHSVTKATMETDGGKKIAVYSI